MKDRIDSCIWWDLMKKVSGSYFLCHDVLVNKGQRWTCWRANHCKSSQSFSVLCRIKDHTGWTLNTGISGYQMLSTWQRWLDVWSNQTRLINCPKGHNDVLEVRLGAPGAITCWECRGRSFAHSFALRSANLQCIYYSLVSRTFGSVLKRV